MFVSKSTIVFLSNLALVWMASQPLVAGDAKPSRLMFAPRMDQGDQREPGNLPVELQFLGPCIEQPPLKQSFHMQAHRGAGMAHPENTLESFQLSWSMGVTPEADMRTTKDGTIVCFHDKTFERTVGNIDEARKQFGIEDLTLAEVQELEVGSFRGEQFKGQRIPTLADAFAAMQGHPDRLLYLDIKGVELDQLIALIQKYDVETQVIFTTSEYSLVRDWKKRVPKSLTLLWNGGSEKELIELLDTYRKANFEGITHLQIHVHVQDIESDEPFMPSISFLRKTGEELKSRGIIFQVLPWKCSDRRAYTRLLELGVESFATDYPEMTLEVVRQYQARQEKQ